MRHSDVERDGDGRLGSIKREDNDNVLMEGDTTAMLGARAGDTGGSSD